MTRCLAAAVLIALGSVLASAQSLQVGSSQPVAPGTFVPIIIHNDQPEAIIWTTGSGLHQVAWGGDRIAGLPAPTPGGPTTWLEAGATITRWHYVPATGPGSSGPHLLILTAIGVNSGLERRGFARLDVQAPAPAPAVLHAHPRRLLEPFDGRGIDWTAADLTWEIANVSPSPVTLSANDAVTVRSLASGALLTSLPLAGLTVPARGALQVTIPIAVLTPGDAFEVSTGVLDPGLGASATFRYGMASSDRVGLHLPAGRVLPAQGALPLRVAMKDFPLAPPIYLVLLAQDGTYGLTISGSGAVIPALLSDPLLGWSAAGGDGLLLQQVGYGVAEPGFPVYNGRSYATGCALIHPGPAFAGATFRVFALALGLGADLDASQSETLTL